MTEMEQLDWGVIGAQPNETASATPDNVTVVGAGTFGSLVNTTDSGLVLNGTITALPESFHEPESFTLGTTVTVAIALGSAAFVVIIVIVVVCFVRRRMKSRKSRAWVDNLTLSYIADSNIDLTKDNYDEMVSLDNDNFLNSLVDAQAFSVYSSPNNNTRQYTYSYF